MSNYELLIEDDVSDYIRCFSESEVYPSQFGLHFVGLMELNEYLDFSGRFFCELSDDWLAVMSKAELSEYEWLIAHMDTMPVPLCHLHTSYIKLVNTHYGFSEDYTIDANTYTSVDSSEADTVRDFLYSRGMDADRVTDIKYQELYMGERLLMRDVSYWLKGPQTRTSGHHGEETVFLDGVSDMDPVEVDALKAEISKWRDAYMSWYEDVLSRKPGLM